MNYWEIIADKLSAGPVGPRGYCHAVTRDGWRWIVDAHKREANATSLNLTIC